MNFKTGVYMALVYAPGGLVGAVPSAILGRGAPAPGVQGQPGQAYIDQSTDPNTLYFFNGSDWDSGGNVQATETVAGIARLATAAEATTGTDDTTIMTPAKVALVAIAGAPDATEVTKGIAQLATTAEATTGTNDTDIMTPLKVAQAIAGGGGDGSFVNLSATGTVTFTSTGAISMTSDTASLFDVTGAGVDLTLSSDAGRVIVNGEEAAANAITLVSAAGGIDVDAALQINIATSQSAADSIVITSSAGGIDILAAGAAAGEDIDIIATGSSVNITSTENVATAIVLSASAGGIDITAAGGAAEDVDIVNTNGSINLTAGEAVADAVVVTASAGGVQVAGAGQITITTTQNAADAMVLTSSAGGIDILATGAAAEDIDIVNTGGSVNVTATENAAEAIYIRTNGGTSETLRLHADQGTGVASINIGSDVGGVTVTSGLASADAINITASNAGGGIDIDAGTAGIIADTTGAVSIDAAAASNVSVSGAGIDLSLVSSAGRVIVNAEEAAANAITLLSAAGGIDADAALQINIATSQNAADAMVLSASAGGIDITAAGAAGEDVDIVCTAGSVNITAGEAVGDAIVLNASNAAGGIDLLAGTGNVSVSSNLVLTSVATQLQMNGGAVTDFIGQSTLSGGTVTVANTNIATTDRIFLTRQLINGSTALGNLTVTALTASTSFVITALTDADAVTPVAGDSSIVNWFIVRQN